MNVGAKQGHEGTEGRRGWRQEVARRGRLPQRLHAGAERAQRRYVNDGQIAQVVRRCWRHRDQGLGRRHDREPVFRQAHAARILFWLAGWISDTGEMSAQIKAARRDPEPGQGLGTTNPGGYPMPSRWLLEKALGTIDDGKRAALSPRRAASPWPIYGVLPLHFEIFTWAMRKELSTYPRVDQSTEATAIKARARDDGVQRSQPSLEGEGRHLQASFFARLQMAGW